MSERGRPDPRLKGLPAGYEYVFSVKPHESEEEFAQRVAAQGIAGQRLLTDGDFNASYHEILDELMTTLVNTKPGQKELREDLYYRIRGLMEIAYKLNGWVTAAGQYQAYRTAKETTQESE